MTIVIFYQHVDTHRACAMMMSAVKVPELMCGPTKISVMASTEFFSRSNRLIEEMSTINTQIKRTSKENKGT